MTGSKKLTIKGNEVCKENSYAQICTIDEAKREIDGSNMLAPEFIAAI